MLVVSAFACDATGVFDDRLRRQFDELVSGMCKALNDPKRLLIIYALREASRSVGELCDLLGAPQSNVSQHLAVLRDRGLVEADRRGNSVFYSIRYPELVDAIEILRSVMGKEAERQAEVHL